MAVQLEVEDLSKVYYGQAGAPGPVEVLSAVSFALAKEEFIAIIGPNGSGKSTLLKLLAGIEAPTAGKISSAGQAAYLPQQLSLLPWRTVEQNLSLPDDVRRTSPRQSPADIRKLLKDFGLLEFAAFYPRALSGGMQQKVALLRTVLCSPSLMLLDEPFAALDAITRLELQRWLLDLKRRTRSSVVCVTHDIREAVFLADTIYVLSQRPGRIKRKFSVPAKPAARNKLETKLYELLVNKA
jgi:ABC-type nitrate/sulfonate/bicarbonate transport system ATPase subunit